MVEVVGKSEEALAAEATAAKAVDAGADTVAADAAAIAANVATAVAAEVGVAVVAIGDRPTVAHHVILINTNRTNLCDDKYRHGNGSPGWRTVIMMKHSSLGFLF